MPDPGLFLLGDLDRFMEESDLFLRDESTLLLAPTPCLDLILPRMILTFGSKSAWGMKFTGESSLRTLAASL